MKETTEFWGKEIANREEKEKAVRQVVARMKDGEVIGAGSGSTVYVALVAMAERIRRESIHIEVVPASLEMSWVCSRLGIPQVPFLQVSPDWTFDGADEVDPAHNLIKGRGGALFREKLLICNSKEVHIVVDRSKRVDRLGSRFPVPVEVFPAALSYVERKLKEIGARELTLRHSEGKDGPLITENGNLILDVRFTGIYKELEEEIKKITGVVESGLFMGYRLDVWEAV